MIAARVKSLVPLPVRQTWWDLQWWGLRGLPPASLANLLRVVSPVDYPRVLALNRRQPARSQSPLIPVHLRGTPRPIVLRRHSSDFEVFRQVFFDQHYGRLPLRDPRVILDAGANVGLSALFFLRSYPRARVIALEPDPANYAVAARNLRGYRSRCTLLPAALWSHRGEVIVQRGVFGDGREWASCVRVDPAGTGPRVAALTLRDIMKQFALEDIDLLKIDIEGAEAAVFSSDDLVPFDHVRCIAIELHDGRCERIFQEFAQAHRFRAWPAGDITVAVRAE
jgi:FkbM family methyltransferase